MLANRFPYAKPVRLPTTFHELANARRVRVVSPEEYPHAQPIRGATAEEYDTAEVIVFTTEETLPFIQPVAFAGLML